MAELKIFSQEWLKAMDDKARKCKVEQGGPEVTTGYYAMRKIKDKWKVSNGRAWWNDPVVVHEIHEYADGTVCAANYIEGVQHKALFGKEISWKRSSDSRTGKH